MTNKVKLLTAFFVLSFAMMMGVMPFSIGGAGVLKALAEESTGDFSVSGGSYGNDYSYDSSTGVLTISGSETYTISNTNSETSTSDIIKVTSENGAKIILAGVNISSSSNSPIEIANTAGKVTIQLEGENTLTATGDAHTGLSILTTEEVTITSDDDGDSYAGSLTVSNDNVNSEETLGGVAIGSESNEVNINITGGIIKAEANGDQYGVAIGSYLGTANITITEGDITAKANGNQYAVAIGTVDDWNITSTANITITGGDIIAEADSGSTSIAIGSYTCNTTTININGGKINAIASNGYEGIAIGSYFSNNTYITITEGDITAKADGEDYGIAIGCSDGYAYITIKGGDITAEADGDYFGVAIGSLSNYVNITIEEGTVKAYADGDEYGVAIGSGANTANIDISGGEVTAEANGTNESASYTVAIGSYYGPATINITNGKVEATADGDIHGLAIGSHSNTATINIEGGTVKAAAGDNGYGNNYGVAIGSDEGAAIITISDGTVTATAMGDVHGLAIGSHNSTATITIEGGTVNATADGNTHGTAIGTDDGTATITITGGTITAEAVDDTDSGIAIAGNLVYIDPAMGTALDVKYSKDGEDTLYVFKTDVTNKVVDGTYFYSNYGGEVIHDDTNVSISQSENGTYNVVVSEYGGDNNARYLESVIVLINAYDTYAVENYEIKNYQEYTKDSENDSIVFPVEINTINDDEVICVLVKTYEHKDAENEKGSIIYYLSDALNGGTAA